MLKKALIMFTILVVALAFAACTPQPVTTLPAVETPGTQVMEPAGQGPSGMDGAVSTGVTMPDPAIDLPAPDTVTSGPGVGSSVDAPSSTGASDDPAASLMEVSGVVKEQKPGLVLISLNDNGGDFMLRISENTKWAQGVSKTIKPGSCITAKVKLEPTLAPPSQGEVFLVVKNG